MTDAEPRNDASPDQGANRFERLSRLKKALLLTSFSLGLIVAAEALALGVAFGLKVTGLSGGETFTDFARAFPHPLISGTPLWGSGPVTSRYMYDPWYGFRWNNRNPSMSLDVRGFLSNGDESRDLRVKGDNTYRIFVLGGSAVAGPGASSPARTISGRLETRLNEWEDRPGGVDFQVVNAGIDAWYSPQELALLQFEIAYLQPDLIIAFDGFNDAFRKTILTRGGPDRLDRYHWNSRQVEVARFLESMDRRFLLPTRLQLWRYSYALDVLRRLSRLVGPATSREVPRSWLDRFPEMTPETLATSSAGIFVPDGTWLDDEQIDTLGSHFNAEGLRPYVANVLFMHAVCEAQGVEFLSVLQPVLLPEYKPTFGDGEEMYYLLARQVVAQRDGVDVERTLSEYFAAASESLGVALNNSETAAFYDFTSVFADIAGTTYVDWVHPNDLGNDLIAAELERIVRARLDVADR